MDKNIIVEHLEASIEKCNELQHRDLDCIPKQEEPQMHETSFKEFLNDMSLECADQQTLTAEQLKEALSDVQKQFADLKKLFEETKQERDALKLELKSVLNAKSIVQTELDNARAKKDKLMEEKREQSEQMDIMSGDIMRLMDKNRELEGQLDEEQRRVSGQTVSETDIVLIQQIQNMNKETERLLKEKIAELELEITGCLDYERGLKKELKEAREESSGLRRSVERLNTDLQQLKNAEIDNQISAQLDPMKFSGGSFSGEKNQGTRTKERPTEEEGLCDTPREEGGEQELENYRYKWRELKQQLELKDRRLASLEREAGNGDRLSELLEELREKKQEIDGLVAENEQLKSLVLMEDDMNNKEEEREGLEKMIALYEKQKEIDRLMVDKLNNEMNQIIGSHEKLKIALEDERKRGRAMVAELTSLKENIQTLKALEGVKKGDLKDINRHPNIATDQKELHEEIFTLREMNNNLHKQLAASPIKQFGIRPSPAKKFGAEGKENQGVMAYSDAKMRRGLEIVQGRLSEMVSRHYELKSPEAVLIHKDLCRQVGSVSRMVEKL